MFFKNFFSIESEQMVISCLILYNYSWNNIYTFLITENFYFENHKILFSVILEFLNLNINFDILSICSRIKNISSFDFFSYLNFLIQKLPNPLNIFFYASIIHNMFILRKILFIINHFSYKIFNFNSNLNVSDLLDYIEINLFDISKNYLKEKNNFFLIGDIFKKYSNNKLFFKNFFLTGFKSLDDILLGIYRGDFLIVAGRPSTGKTSFSLNILKYISEFYNLPVIIFSMEMSVNQLFTRLLSILLDEDHENIINILDNKVLNLNKFFIDKISSLKIFIDDTSTLSILHIYSKCRFLIKEYGDLGLVVIDYLQLMTTNYNQNRVFEVSEISRSLKCLARELNVPIIAISQLNRNSELRSNKRPIISDLRESGSIEQDADIILFIYRSFLHNSLEKNVINKDSVEIIVSKHRNGSTGKVFLNFIDKKSKFF
ncbi:MAG: replicative DNA helicase [Candidatus Nasuia deltocephalinicola]